MTLDIADYKTESWTVSKSITDALWVLSAKIDRHNSPAFVEQIQACCNDHNNAPHTRFVGIIPTTDIVIATVSDKSQITGYDQAWYLTVQYVPADERIVAEDVNPSDTIGALLGGTSWATATGIKPHQINTVAVWEDIKKPFEFGDRCTRWQAIQEICDYCNFVFVVKWHDDAGTWVPSAYFIHELDIDDPTNGLNIPDATTITNPDPNMVSGVLVTDSPAHKYNRVMVSGYDATTNSYIYATAETAAVVANTEIPIEYVCADAAIMSQSAAGGRAQELLDFFQDSAKIYSVRFMKRMDLELYQKIIFSGYSKIESDVMRITKITYSKQSVSDIVTIEFSKDQAIQQLRRLDRAVNPDYVSGSQDLINADLAEVGLIDVFDMPIASGSMADDLWTTNEAYVQLFSPAPLWMQGWSVDGASGVRGHAGADFSLWGAAGSQEAEGIIEFLRWHSYDPGKVVNQYIEIEQPIHINNTPFPTIYFDIDTSKPTFIQATTSPSWKELSVSVAGDSMFSCYVVGGDTPNTTFWTDIRTSSNIIVGNRIMGWDNDDLVFWDNATGRKTLSELASAGEIPEYDGLTNPLTTHLNMGGHDINNCDDIECDDIECDDIIMNGRNSTIYGVGSVVFTPRTSYPTRVPGRLWYDSDDNEMKFWDGSYWRRLVAIAE